MPNPGTISIAVGSCIACKASEMFAKKGAIFGIKTFVKSDAFDHFVATGICAVCAGVSTYGLVMAVPLTYEHARAFVKSVKPVVTEAMDAAEEAA